MAFTMDWTVPTVEIPQADLTLVTGTKYSITIDAIKAEIDRIMATEEGINFDDIHAHTTTVTLGGTTWARIIEFIGTTAVEFEDGAYSVDLLDGNSNVLDVQVDNQVSTRSNNSAGLIIGSGGLTAGNITAIADAVWDEDITTHQTADSAGAELTLAKAAARLASQLAAAGL